MQLLVAIGTVTSFVSTIPCVRSLHLIKYILEKNVDQYISTFPLIRFLQIKTNVAMTEDFITKFPFGGLRSASSCASH